MANIKIVRMIARLNIGGPAVNASILTSSLDKSIFSTKIIYGSLGKGEGNAAYLMDGCRLDTYTVPELGREISPIDDVAAFFKIVRILKKEKPDIVHTHTAKAGTLGRLAAIICGVRIKIHTFHGNVFRGYFGKTKTLIFILIERTLGLFTDKVVVLSQKQKDDIVNRFRIVPDKKCVIVPLGVDESRLREIGSSKSFREEIGIGRDEIAIGIIGRLVPVKNHRMFLLAASEITRKRGPLSVQYIVIGDGELKKELLDLAVSLGIDPRVHFVGWRTDLGVVYAGLDIVALTSSNEGTPLSLIEAMILGKPVVATDVGGVSDIVKDEINGILVEKDDVGGFSEALIRLVDDGTLRKWMGSAGAEIGKRFSKENLVNSMSQLYIDCIKEKR